MKTPESRAWRTIAKAFRTKTEERTKAQRRIASEGLCRAIEHYARRRFYFDMRTRLDDDRRKRKKSVVDYFWPLETRRSDILRAELAERFAKESETK